MVNLSLPPLVSKQRNLKVLRRVDILSIVTCTSSEGKIYYSSSIKFVFAVRLTLKGRARWAMALCPWKSTRATVARCKTPTIACIV